MRVVKHLGPGVSLSQSAGLIIRMMMRVIGMVMGRAYKTRAQARPEASGATRSQTGAGAADHPEPAQNIQNPDCYRSGAERQV